MFFSLACQAFVVKTLAGEEGQKGVKIEGMAIDIPEYVGANPRLASAYKQLVKAEQKTIARADEKIADQENRLRLVRDFKGRVSEVKESLMPFKSVRDFKELVGSSSHPDILDVSSVDKNLARVGSYEFEVLELANSDSIMTYGFRDRDRSEVGVGYVSFKTPEGDVKDVYINSDNNTLDGVAKSINQAGLGVYAHVVNDGTDAENPWRIVISGENTGWRHDYEWPQFYMVDGDLDLDIDRNRDGASAIVRFNGHPIMLDENKVKELLPGVTFDLKKAQPGQTIKFEVAPDYEKISGKAKNFVEKINSVFQFIQDQNSLDAESFKDPNKALGGDISLTSIESRFRTILQTASNDMDEVTVRRLHDVGIEFTREGTLNFDGEKFQNRLESDFHEVEHLFSGSGPLGGLANELIRVAEGVVRFGDGMMTIREKNLQDKIGELKEDKEADEEKVLEKLKKTKVDFSKAEQAMEEMQSISQNLRASLPS